MLSQGFGSSSYFRLFDQGLRSDFAHLPQAETKTMADAFDISGKWTLSRALSDDTEEMLVLQNFGYFLRKAARFGSMTIVFKHDTKGDPQTLLLTVIPPAGFAVESRVRTLNGEKVKDYHFLLGTNYIVWDKKTKADELDEYFLEEEWADENLLLEDICSGDGKFINYGVRLSAPRWWDLLG